MNNKWGIIYRNELKNSIWHEVFDKCNWSVFSRADRLWGYITNELELQLRQIVP
jgi:hypothetical protein